MVPSTCCKLCRGSGSSYREGEEPTVLRLVSDSSSMVWDNNNLEVRQFKCEEERTEDKSRIEGLV